MDIRNKRVFFLGDSITAGVGASSPENCYVNLFRKAYPSADIINYGISATRIARQTKLQDWETGEEHFVKRAEGMEPGADLIVVFGGTNDYGHGDAPLGAMGDRREDSFYGAYYLLLEKLFLRYPEAQILILTPLHRVGGEEYANHQGAVLPDYVRAIRETAELFSVPVLDMYANSGINPNLARMKETYMPDGLHPSDAGHRRLFERLDSYIKRCL